MDETPLPVIDWNEVATGLDREGYALLPDLLDAARARALANAIASGATTHPAAQPDGVGRGQLCNLPDPLPDPLASWCRDFHAQLAPVANRWSKLLGWGRRFPGQSPGYRALASRLGEGDYLPLHHGAAADAFPLQLVLLLSEPGTDFTGGEFVMTEQRPRMQSRPMVLPLRRGDGAFITAAHRPAKGSKGHYQVTLKHAISRVRSGERIGIELSFTDPQG